MAPGRVIAGGLVVQVAGFIFDAYYHASHPSAEVTPPQTQLWLHSGIYAGLLAVLAAAIAGLVRTQATDRPAGWGMWAVLAGALVELAGVSLDMYAHGQGRELDLYHNLAYGGVLVIAAGYLAMLAAARRRRAA